MKKYISLVLGLTALTAGVYAQSQNASTRWFCDLNSGVRFCGVDIVSGTAAADLGSVDVSPARQNTVVATANQSAVSGLVTPTLVLRLGGAIVATQTISATLTGNPVAITVPFDNVTVSFTNPATISATNSVRLTVVGR